MAMITAPQTIVAPAELIDRLAVEWMRHADGPIAQRISRGAEIVKAQGVERTAQPFLFLVVSQSDSNRCYHVDHGVCDCRDAERGWQCKHIHAARLAVQAERADAEAHDPTPDPDDTYYCVLCDEPIPAAEVVETAHGFMHERCAMTEPTPDPDAPIGLELSGRGYLTLVPATGLPPALGGCTRLPYTAEQARIISELYGDDPSVA